MIDDFDEVKAHVVQAMRDHTARYSTRLSAVIEDDVGEHVGTGTFLELTGKPYILTNEHVAATRIVRPLAFALSNHYLRWSGAFQALPPPLDLAIAPVPAEAWTQLGHSCLAVSVRRLASRHQPVDGELLYVCGFAGERSHFSPALGTLFTTGTPYLTQETSVPNELRSPATFGLYCNTAGALSVDAATRGLPDPHGFSGSLVWDTKAISCVQSGEAWHPEMAVVTGLVWGWPSSAVSLVATKIQYVRAFLLEALRREAAYSRWLDRGCPPGDDWVDWFAAETLITNLG